MSASAVAFFNTDSERLATCGIDTALYVWQLDRVARKLTKISVQLGQCRRNFTALAISEDDRFMFVGSTSGDVVEVGCNLYSTQVINASCALTMPAAT